jgi:hypothetical protein
MGNLDGVGSGGWMLLLGIVGIAALLMLAAYLLQRPQRL